VPEAIAAFREAIRLTPDNGGYYSNYGRALFNFGRHDEAIEACRQAIRLNPDDGGAHYNLGTSLAAQGQLRDALAAFGEAQRLDRSLSESRQWRLLYHAARAAAKAAAGKGKDEPPPDDTSKRKLRRQALDWLRAEYKAWYHALESGAPQAGTSIAEALRGWKQDADLGGIRDDAALARLPEADRNEWQALWADVDSLLRLAATLDATEKTLSSIQNRARALEPSKPGEAEPLLREAMELTRQQFGTANPRTAGAMAQLGTSLIQQGKWSAAEPILRECLAIREKSQPDEWTTFNTRSLLGGSLLGQEKYAEAEPLIVAGYEGMKAREAKIPAPGKPRLIESSERVVKLYEAWGKPAKGAEWRVRVSKPSVDANTPHP
jgi:tetratricopeptide (TPR) repeat protein